MEGNGKRHYVLITISINYCIIKHFCCYCLQAVSTEEIVKHHIKDYFKINGKQKIIMPTKGEYVKFKTYEKKIKSPFIIHADFESILYQIMEGKIQKSLTKTNIKNIYARSISMC